MIYLNKYVAAHGKSYRLCGQVQLSIQMASGLIGCETVAAFIPPVQIAVATADALPAGITIFVFF